MSVAGDKVKQALKKYVDHMRSQGREPTALYVTKQQYETLRAEAKQGPEWKPKFMGFEVHKHD